MKRFHSAKHNTKKRFWFRSCGTKITHPNMAESNIYNIYNIIYILYINIDEVVWSVFLVPQLRNQNLEHFFTTVKSEKKNLRGDNLKIC